VCSCPAGPCSRGCTAPAAAATRHAHLQHNAAAVTTAVDTATIAIAVAVAAAAAPPPPLAPLRRGRRVARPRPLQRREPRQRRVPQRAPRRGRRQRAVRVSRLHDERARPQARRRARLGHVQRARLLAAAAEDEPWSLPAIWLMLRLGLTRSEVLALRRDHVERSDSDPPVVFVFYDDVTKRGKERKLATDTDFAAIYKNYLAAKEPTDTLFPHVPPAVNGMVERVRSTAGITKDVSPQTLRHTFAVDKARAGADEAQLLILLGLANDPRNRDSVARYVKLASPPLA